MQSVANQSDRVTVRIRLARIRCGCTCVADVTGGAGDATREDGGGVCMSSLSEMKFLTVAEVAAVMRVSKMTVYRLVHSGELASVRVGRSFRVPERAVHDYLKAGFPESIQSQVHIGKSIVCPGKV